MRWIITGTRFGRRDLEEQLNQILIELGRPTMLILGCEPKGVDKQAQEWAKQRGFPFEVFYADWKDFGDAAGPIRNEAMVDYANPKADICIGFPAPNKPNKGTNNCMNYARKQGFRVLER